MTERLHVVGGNWSVVNEDADKNDGSNGFDSNFQSLFECGICKSRFTTVGGPRSPRSTPCCGHTVCTECVTKVLHYATTNHLLAACPFCRKAMPLGDVDELAVSRVVLQLMEMYCGLCLSSATAATLRHCINCNLNLCEACLRTHSRAGASQRLRHLAHFKNVIKMASQKAVEILHQQCNATLSRLEVLEQHCQYAASAENFDENGDMCNPSLSAEVYDKRVQIMEDLCHQLPCLFSGEMHIVKKADRQSSIENVDVHEVRLQLHSPEFVNSRNALSDAARESADQEVFEVQEDAVSPYWANRLFSLLDLSADESDGAAQSDLQRSNLEEEEDSSNDWDSAQLQVSAPFCYFLNGENIWCATFLPDGSLVIGNAMELMLCQTPLLVGQERQQRELQGCVHVTVSKRLPSECRWAVEALSATQTSLVASFPLGAGNTFAGLMSFSIPQLETIARRSEQMDVRGVAADCQSDLVFAAQPDLHRVLVLQLPCLRMITEISADWLRNPMSVTLVDSRLVVSDDQHVTIFSALPPFSFLKVFPIRADRLATVHLPLSDTPSLLVLQDSFLARVISTTSGQLEACVCLQEDYFPECRDPAWEVTCYGHLLCFCNPSCSSLVFMNIL